MCIHSLVWYVYTLERNKQMTKKQIVFYVAFLVVAVLLVSWLDTSITNSF